MMEVTVRPYRESDHEQFRWLYERTPPAGQVAYAPQPWPEHLDHIYDHHAAFWVAVNSDGEREGLAGSLGLEHVEGESVGPPVPDFIDTTPRTTRVHEMRVAPEVQRQGIGRQLMDAALEWSRAQGYEWMILETTPQQEAAVAFYKASGFTDVGRSMIGRYELVWFRRPL